MGCIIQPVVKHLRIKLHIEDQGFVKTVVLSGYQHQIMTVPFKVFEFSELLRNFFSETRNPIFERHLKQFITYPWKNFWIRYNHLNPCE